MNTKHTIKSDSLEITISEKGAELYSIIDTKTSFDFLWCGDDKVWNRKAPVLFPIVGKPNNSRIKIDGKTYQMNQHGFARDMQFELVEIYSDLAKFMLSSDDVSLDLFPYQYRFFITYQVLHNKLEITYSVINTDNKKMYFSVGAHPGFMLPTAELNQFEIEFETKENLERYLLQDGLFNGKTESLGSNAKKISLSSGLFEKDAIVFKNLKSNWLELKNKNGTYKIKLDFKGFPYLGIWTKPGQESFVCLEPWLGLADKVDFDEEFCQKEGIQSIEAGSFVTYTYSLTFTAG